jgi:hypothetical protein
MTKQDVTASSKFYAQLVKARYAYILAHKYNQKGRPSTGQKGCHCLFSTTGQLCLRPGKSK